MPVKKLSYVYTFQSKLQQRFVLRMRRKLSSKLSGKVGLLPQLLGIDVSMTSALRTVE